MFGKILKTHQTGPQGKEVDRLLETHQKKIFQKNFIYLA